MVTFPKWHVDLIKFWLIQVVQATTDTIPGWKAKLWTVKALVRYGKLLCCKSKNKVQAKTESHYCVWITGIHHEVPQA